MCVRAVHFAWLAFHRRREARLHSVRFNNSLDGRIKTAADVLSYPGVTIDGILTAMKKKQPSTGKCRRLCICIEGRLSSSLVLSE